MCFQRWQILGWPSHQAGWAWSMRSFRSSGPPQRLSSWGNSPACEHFFDTRPIWDLRYVQTVCSGAMSGLLESWCLRCWASGKCRTAGSRWSTTRAGWRRNGSERPVICLKSTLKVVFYHPGSMITSYTSDCIGPKERSFHPSIGSGEQSHKHRQGENQTFSSKDRQISTSQPSTNKTPTWKRHWTNLRCSRPETLPVFDISDWEFGEAVQVIP